MCTITFFKVAIKCSTRTQNFFTTNQTVYITLRLIVRKNQIVHPLRVLPSTMWENTHTHTHTIQNVFFTCCFYIRWKRSPFLAVSHFVSASGSQNWKKLCKDWIGVCASVLQMQTAAVIKHLMPEPTALFCSNKGSKVDKQRFPSYVSYLNVKTL